MFIAISDSCGMLNVLEQDIRPFDRGGGFVIQGNIGLGKTRLIQELQIKSQEIEDVIFLAGNTSAVRKGDCWQCELENDARCKLGRHWRLVHCLDAFSGLRAALTMLVVET